MEEGEEGAKGRASWPPEPGVPGAAKGKDSLHREGRRLEGGALVADALQRHQGPPSQSTFFLITLEALLIFVQL